MTKYLTVFCVFAALAAAGCGEVYNPGGTCPEPREIEVAPGFYFSQDGSFHTTSEDVPASQGTGHNITVDREADQVRLTYELDGKTVIETYKITNSEFMAY